MEASQDRADAAAETIVDGPAHALALPETVVDGRIEALAIDAPPPFGTTARRLPLLAPLLRFPRLARVRRLTPLTELPRPGRRRYR